MRLDLHTTQAASADPRSVVGSLIAKRILIEVVVMTLNLEVANTEITRAQRQGFAKALQRSPKSGIEPQWFRVSDKYNHRAAKTPRLTGRHHPGITQDHRGLRDPHPTLGRG